MSEQTTSPQITPQQPSLAHEQSPEIELIENMLTRLGDICERKQLREQEQLLKAVLSKCNELDASVSQALTSLRNCNAFGGTTAVRNHFEQVKRERDQILRPSRWRPIEITLFSASIAVAGGLCWVPVTFDHAADVFWLGLLRLAALFGVAASHWE